MTHSLGLLGASVNEEEWKAGGLGYLKERRLQEIERRILAIEAASADTHPKGGDSEAAPALLSGAVPSEETGDAQ